MAYTGTPTVEYRVEIAAARGDEIQTSDALRVDVDSLSPDAAAAVAVALAGYGASFKDDAPAAEVSEASRR